MSIENPTGPQYAEIKGIQRESGSEPLTHGDLNVIAESSESQDQLPSLPLKRKVGHHTNLPPAVPTTRRPSGAIETLAMGIFQPHPRKASVDSGRLHVYSQCQERHDSKPPPLFPRARRPSEHGDPSTSLPEKNMPQVAFSGHRDRVYSNLQSSDPSKHLLEMDMPQTAIPQTITEQEETPCVNAQPTVAKKSVESHDEGPNENTEDNVCLEFGNTRMAPLEAQQT